MEIQKNAKAKAILNKKSKAGGIAILDFQLQSSLSILGGLVPLHGYQHPQTLKSRI